MENNIVATIYNSSIWCKIVIVFAIAILYYLLTNKHVLTEGFVQRENFLIKENNEIYDAFYADIYDQLVQDKVKNEYEVGTIINLTKPTKNSFLLDVGSGTGDHVAIFNSKNILLFTTTRRRKISEIIGVNTFFNCKKHSKNDCFFNLFLGGQSCLSLDLEGKFKVK